MNNYVLYVDLDGVLVDFDKGYEKLTGVHTHHADRQGSDIFWDLYRKGIDNSGKTEKQYWEELEWTSDGQVLWDYLKKYNPHILTAPSVNPDLPKTDRYNISHNESMQGKTEWVKRLDNMNKLYFKATSYKKELAKSNRILIDDRKPTIEGWIEKGGIGIFHTSTENTILQLIQLGL